MALYTAGVRWYVEMGLASSQTGSVWDTGLWDTAVWGGGEPYWIDVTEYCLSVHTEMGRQFFTERMETGTGSFVFNNADGWFNPNFGATLPGDLDIRPGRWIRLRVEHDGGVVTPDPVPVPAGTTWTDPVAGPWESFGDSITYQGPDVPAVFRRDRFVGVITSIDETYPQGGSDSVTLIEAADFQSYFANFAPIPLSTPLPVELSSVRVDRLLDDYGWETGTKWRNIRTGVHTVDASTVDLNYAYEIQETAKAEGGAFWFDGLQANFSPRDWLTTNPRSTSVQSYPGRGLEGDPVLLTADSDWRTDNIQNDIQLARRQDPTTFATAAGVASKALYGERVHRYQQLFNENQADVQALADRRLVAFQYDHQRLLGATVAALEPSQAQDLLDVRIGDLWRVTVPLTLRGWGYATEAHVQGYGFDITTTDWTCTVRLDQSQRGNPSEFAAFDDGFDDGYA